MKYTANIPVDFTITTSRKSDSRNLRGTEESRDNHDDENKVTVNGSIKVEFEGDISWADMLSFRLAELKELPTTIKAVGEAVKGVAAEITQAVIATSQARCESYRGHRQEELDSINRKLRVQGDNIEALERKIADEG